jgi:hypothetical protein
VLREDPRNSNLLFAGTEFGAYLSLDKGRHWSLLGNNLPMVRVDDIKIHPREHDLILGTHGRSLWVLDDITALEELAAGQTDQQLRVFDVRPAIQWRQVESSGGMEAQKAFAAPNPAYGALINYSLKNVPRGKVAITITDDLGKVVRQFDGSQYPGINRATWDLRLPTPSEPTAEQRWAQAGGFFYKSVQGPFVEPGQYKVTVSVNNETVSKSITVEEDPAIQITPRDRIARHEAISRAYNLYKSGIEGETRFRALRASVTSAINSWKVDNAPAVSDSVRKETEAFAKNVEAISALFAGPADPMNVPPEYVPPPVQERVAHVLFILESYTAAPRKRDLDQLAELTIIQADALKQLEILVGTGLKRLNQAYRDAGVPYIALPLEKKPPATGAKNFIDNQ